MHSHRKYRATVSHKTITSNHGKEWLLSPLIDVYWIKLRNNWYMTCSEKYTRHPINSFRKPPISSRLIGISASLCLFHCALLMLSLDQSDVCYIMIKNNLYVPVTLLVNAAVLIGSIEQILEAQHKHSAAGAQLWRNERSCHFLFAGRISLYSVIKGECTMQHRANAESTEEDAFSFKCLLESFWGLRLPVQPHLIMKESLLIISSHSVKEGGT